MGKKSKANAAPSLRCVQCKVFMKSADKAIECPCCDEVFCEICAFSGSGRYRHRNGIVPFVCCHNEDCQSPPRCHDCACGYTSKKKFEEDRRRREKGEPSVVREKRCSDLPMFMCGNCYETLCYDCSTFQTKGVNGHYFCTEDGCYKIRCHKCCIESGDPEHFIMYCSGCKLSKCSECDPGKKIDFDTGKYYCGKCSSDENIVSNKNRLVKVFETTQAPKQGEATAGRGMPKYQYFQDDNFMKVQILEPNVLHENLEVKFSPKELIVKIKKQGAKGLETYTVIDGALPHKVDVSKCKYTITDEKVHIKLKKKEMAEWHALLAHDRRRERQKRAQKQSKKETVSPAAVEDADSKSDKSPVDGRNIRVIEPANMARRVGNPSRGAGRLQFPNNPLRCTHVALHPDSLSSTQFFIDTYFDEILKSTPFPTDGCEPAFNGLIAKKAIMTAMGKHPNMLKDGRQRKMIREHFVGIGADTLLSDTLLSTAHLDLRMLAVAISMLEVSTSEVAIWEQNDQESLKLRDAVEGCTRSLFKFYIKRTTCSCLDEKYSKLKADMPKTGICHHCKKRSERSNLFACSNCKQDQYCSRKCQRMAWPLHNCFAECSRNLNNTH